MHHCIDAGRRSRRYGQAEREFGAKNRQIREQLRCDHAHFLHFAYRHDRHGCGFRAGSDFHYCAAV